MLLLGSLIWGYALIMSMKVTFRKIREPKIQFVSDLQTFESIISSDSPKLSRVKVTPNFSPITDEHPVVDAVLSRWRAKSKPGKRSLGDGKKIALAIEGGGMRGCVSAGATAAINILGLDDTIDTVYGSSAGAMIGAYFISRQFSGVQIYHDILPAAGKRFIDKGKLLFAAGLPGWLNLFLRRNRGTIDEIMSFIPDPETSGIKRPKEIVEKSLTDVFNLDFLLVQVMGVLQPLDYDIFTKNEKSQPLKIVASSLRTMRPIIMSRDNGNYGDMPSLLECIRASMSVPGITGRLMALKENIISPSSVRTAVRSLPAQFNVPFIVQKRRKPHHPYQTKEFLSASKISDTSGLEYQRNGENNAKNSIENNGDNNSENNEINGENIETVVVPNRLKKKVSKIIGGLGRVVITVLGLGFGWVNSIRKPKVENVVFTVQDVVASSSRINIEEINDRREIENSNNNNNNDNNNNNNNNNNNDNNKNDNNNNDNRNNKNTPQGAQRSQRNQGDKGGEGEGYPIDCEPIVDAFFAEPLPYRSAVEDGASHVIVLRTRPDPCVVLGKGPGVFENLIAKRFFNAYKEQGASEWLIDLNHHRIYAEDVLRLSLGSQGPKEGVNVNGQYVHLLSIAPDASRVEVGQLETRREKVLRGMQDGARRVFEIFGPSILGVSTAEEIEELVQSVFPDAMLLRDVSLEDYERTLVVQGGVDNQL